MVTVAAAPAGKSVPLLAEAFSQTEVFPRLQLNGVTPVLVRERSKPAGLTGMPNGVVTVKPVPGVINNASVGAARKLIKLLPFGEPQPVARSKPGTAKKFVGLPLLVLLPVVRS